MSKLEELKCVLLEIIDNIDAGNSNMSDEQLDFLLTSINQATNTKNKLSKHQACKQLGISRSTFDKGVKEGRIPEGRKEVGFKEKFGLTEDLINVKQ